ncbi:MAG: glycosyltransferase family protein [Armatimonadota bacterium]
MISSTLALPHCHETPQTPDIAIDPATAYPRVLMVTKSCINNVDGFSASVKNWFHDWPQNHIATLYSGGPEPDHTFCDQCYQLTARDRRWGTLFMRLKHSPLGVQSHVTATQPILLSSTWRSRGKRLLRRFGSSLLETGLWETLFPPRLSTHLLQWVADFQPDLLYAQGHDLAFMWLPLLLHKHFGIPICLQISDDWPKELYASSVVAPLIRPVVERTFRELLDSTSIRFSTSEVMSREYWRRYRTSFQPLMISDDFSRFQRAVPRRVAEDHITSIIYTGAISSNRWQSLADLARVAQEINDEGHPIVISAFVTDIPEAARTTFAQFSVLRLYPPLRNDEVPEVCKGADILFLPEGFSPEYYDYIKLSISTKAHLYMMSQRPILLYGPSGVGIVEYGRTWGWAHVVDRNDPVLLRNAIQRLMIDRAYVDRLVHRATEVAEQRHDASVVREYFRKTLLAATDYR